MASFSEKDYYIILGIMPDADEGDIKQAFRKLAKMYHPDSFKGKKEDAERFFADIKEAYDVLGAPESRREYDFARAEMLKHKSDQQDSNDDIRYQDNAYDEFDTVSNQSRDANSEQEYGCTKQDAMSSERKRHFWQLVVIIGLAIIFIRHAGGGSFGIWDDFVASISPTDNDEKCIENYFDAIRSENISAADSCTSDDLYKYNKAIIELLNSGSDSEMYEPLFENAHNFSYKVLDHKRKGGKIYVSIMVTNIDCYSVVKSTISSYDKDYLESLDDSQVADLLSTQMSQNDYNFTDEFEIILSKHNGNWTIQTIDEVKDFANTLTGYTSKLEDFIKEMDK